MPVRREEQLAEKLQRLQVTHHEIVASAIEVGGGLVRCQGTGGEEVGERRDLADRVGGPGGEHDGG